MITLVLNDSWKDHLKSLVELNEQQKGHRVLIDYAILLASHGDSNVNKMMTDFVEGLYAGGQIT